MNGLSSRSTAIGLGYEDFAFESVRVAEERAQHAAEIVDGVAGAVLDEASLILAPSYPV